MKPSRAVASAILGSVVLAGAALRPPTTGPALHDAGRTSAIPCVRARRRPSVVPPPRRAADPPASVDTRAAAAHGRVPGGWDEVVVALRRHERLLPTHVKLLRHIAESGAPADQHRAMVEIMRLQGSSEFVSELIRRARAGAPGRPWEHLRRFDRIGAALASALIEEHERACGSAAGPDDVLGPLIELALQDPSAAGAALVDAIARRSGPPSASLLAVVHRAQRLPDSAATRCAAVLEAGPPDAALRVSGLLACRDLGWAESADGVRRALLYRLRAGTSLEERRLVAIALGNLPDGAGESVRALLDCARSHPDAAGPALGAVLRISRRREPGFPETALDRMVDAYDACTAEGRAGIVDLLVDRRPAQGIDLVHRHSADPSPTFRFASMDALGRAADPAQALPVLLELGTALTADEASTYCGALAALDPRLEDAASGTTWTALVGSADARVAASALERARCLHGMTADLAAAIAQVVRGSALPARRLAIEALRDSARFGADGGHLVPIYVEWLRADADTRLATVSPDAPHACWCVSELGVVAHWSTDARAALLDQLVDPSPARRAAAVVAFGPHQPSARERSIMGETAEHDPDPRVRRLASQVLERGRWAPAPTRRAD